MMKSDVSFYVHVNGKPVTEYFHEDKVYIEGRRGSAYELVLRNFTGTRKKVVLSVDGLNILTGDSTWERGYVLDPWGTASIPGWRIDSGNVADFVFSEPSRSYNAKNDGGDARNVGVIGCLVFDEKPALQFVWNPQPYYYNPAPYYYPYNPVTFNDHTGAWPLYYDTTIGGGGFTFNSGGSKGMSAGGVGGACNSIGAGALGAAIETSRRVNLDVLESSEPDMVAFAAAPTAAPAMGTAWGQSQQFETKSVNYDFEKTARYTLAIYYDSRHNLIRKGINVHEPVRYRQDPNPFPGRDGCPFPK